MKNLKQRVLTGWPLSRLLYLGLGSAFVVNSAITEQWFGMAFGAYFASMGLFAFECAFANCFGSNCATDADNKHNSKELMRES